MEDLVEWRSRRGRMPLILEGARQVGKTYLLKRFGDDYFDNTVYVNFDNPDADITELFAGKVEPKRIVEFLSLKYATTIDPDNTLIIFDEIQENTRALTALKYFNESASEYHIVASGSLLGIALHSGTSFPVGQVDHLRLEPMDFEEYLWALGKEEKADYIRENPEDKQITFGDELKDDLYHYLSIGGMPKAVLEWTTQHDFESVERILHAILADYQNDFTKHNDNTTAEKMRYVWQSIPSQFAKENHKFVYGVAREGARAREYEFAIQWLVDAGLVRKVNLTSSGRHLPLSAYQDLRVFKLYLLDVGLLRVLSKLSPSAIIGNDDVFRQYGGAFAEQYVLQQIQTRGRRDDVFYWTGSQISEIDFVTTYADNVVPIEVKSGENVRAKSMRVFRDEYDPKLSVRFSMLPLEYNKGLLNIPLYNTFLLDGLAERYLSLDDTI